MQEEQETKKNINVILIAGILVVIAAFIFGYFSASKTTSYKESKKVYVLTAVPEEFPKELIVTESYTVKRANLEEYRGGEKKLTVIFSSELPAQELFRLYKGLFSIPEGRWALLQSNFSGSLGTLFAATPEKQTIITIVSKDSGSEVTVVYEPIRK